MLPGSLMWFSAGRFSIKALPIELDVHPRLVGAVILKNRTISPAVQHFIQTVREW